MRRVLNKRQDINNVQNRNIYVNVQTVKSEQNWKQHKKQ
jgi:hypothetical protein